MKWLYRNREYVSSANVALGVSRTTAADSDQTPLQVCLTDLVTRRLFRQLVKMYHCATLRASAFVALVVFNTFKNSRAVTLFPRFVVKIDETQEASGEKRPKD